MIHKPKNIIIGKIFADWCGHCTTLKPEWEKMKKQIKLNMGRALKNVNIEFVEFGDTEENKKMGKQIDSMIDEFNQKYGNTMNQKLSHSGFPTIFKLCNNKIEYYNGERISDKMYKWSISGCMY